MATKPKTSFLWPCVCQMCEIQLDALCARFPDACLAYKPTACVFVFAAGVTQGGLDAGAL